jgi:adenine-specific DNA-methyltransferase
MSMQKPKGNPVSRTAPDFFAERIEEFKTMFPEAITEGKFDFDKMRMALGEEVDGRQERYSFTWAGKKDSIRLLQVPSRATLIPKNEESITFDTTKNIFIEGDSLEVMKLLWKSYFGRIKMIYIDPPYNTGNDFIYNDNYTDPLATYLMLTGQKDAEGDLLVSNPETSGRYHSAWLSMLYPRLFLARQMLTDDGVAFVSIDDNEVHNLRMIMNEIFGEENFVALITAQTNPRGRTLDPFIAKTHEFIMVYARNAGENALSQIPKTEKALAEYDKEDAKGKYRELELRNRNPMFNRRNRPLLFFPVYVNPVTKEVSLVRQGDSSVEVYPLNSKGEEGCWTWGKEKVGNNLSMLTGRQVSTGAWRIYRKDYLPAEGATTKEKSIWLDKTINHENGKEELGKLFGRTPFDFPKSVDLMKKCIQLGTDKDSQHIIMDFLAGSGTTAHAVLEMNRNDGGNRQFLMVQLPESTPEASTAKKDGYNTIADIGKERIRRVIKKMEDGDKGKLDLAGRPTPEDLGFRVFTLAESNCRPWKGVEEKDPEAYARQMELYLDPLVDGWKEENVLYELALKEGYSLTSRIERVTQVTENNIWKVTDDEKEQSFFVCLDDNLKGESIKSLALNTDNLFVCRDKALDDELAANLALQCNLSVI